MAAARKGRRLCCADAALHPCFYFLKEVLRLLASYSMNFWGFTPAIFDELETYFEAFLRSDDAKTNIKTYIAEVMDALGGGDDRFKTE